MISCPYCAHTETKKDSFGYCKEYDCFTVSGKKAKYDLAIKTIEVAYFENKGTGSVSGPVTNSYDKRHRAIGSLVFSFEKEFGFNPAHLFPWMPEKYFTKPWDKNIRW